MNTLLKVVFEAAHLGIVEDPAKAKANRDTLDGDQQ
jgi:hypothetical protein